MNFSNVKNDNIKKNHEGKTIYVGIGEIALGHSNDILKIPSLGSCIGLVIYPKKVSVATMAHIVLPQSPDRGAKKKNRWGPAKYADQAIPTMINLLAKQRIDINTLSAKMVGGAKMFGHVTPNIDIGMQNVSIIRRFLFENNIKMEKSFTGGDTGVSVVYNVDTRKLVVTPTGGNSIFL